MFHKQYFIYLAIAPQKKVIFFDIERHWIRIHLLEISTFAIQGYKEFQIVFFQQSMSPSSTSRPGRWYRPN